MKVGFIGLGRMGRVMAKRLAEDGHDVVVYNRSAQDFAELETAGARVTSSVRDACGSREVVFTMLSNDEALSAVVHGDAGMIASMANGAIHVAMGTHGVTAIRQIARDHERRAQRFLAAPVMGRPEVAAEGKVLIAVGGESNAAEACAPLFARLGRRTLHVGSAPESASAVKLANNYMLGCAIEAQAEAFSLARAYGVDPHTLYDVATDGLFSGAPAYKVYGQIIADEAFDRAGFTARLALKDAVLALDAGAAAGVPLPSGEIWRNRLIASIDHGDGEKDASVVSREQERQVRPRRP